MGIVAHHYNLVKELRGECMSSYRVNLGPNAERELNEIIKSLHLKGKEEAIRKALSLLNFVAKQKRRGSVLVLENQQEHTKTQVDL